jgi:hypothetical protein
MNSIHRLLVTGSLLAVASVASATPIDVDALLGPLAGHALYGGNYVGVAGGAGGNQAIYGDIRSNGYITIGASVESTGAAYSGAYLTTGDGSTVGGGTSSVAATTVGANSVISGHVVAGQAVTMGANSEIIGTVESGGALTVGAGAFRPLQCDAGPVPVGPDARHDVDAAVDGLRSLLADAEIPAGVIASGRTLTPGVYNVPGFLAVPADAIITLDAQQQDGDFIFNIAGYLSLGAGANIEVINGTGNNRVVWALDGYLSMGASATVPGVVISKAYIASGAGGTVTSVGDSCSGLYAAEYITLAPGTNVGSGDHCRGTVAGQEGGDANCLTDNSGSFIADADEECAVDFQAAFDDGVTSVDITADNDGVYAAAYVSGADSIDITSDNDGVRDAAYASGADSIDITSDNQGVRDAAYASGAESIDITSDNAGVHDAAYASGADSIDITSDNAGVHDAAYASGADSIDITSDNAGVHDAAYASGADSIDITSDNAGVHDAAYSSGAESIDITADNDGVYAAAFVSGADAIDRTSGTERWVVSRDNIGTCLTAGMCHRWMFHNGVMGALNAPVVVGLQPQCDMLFEMGLAAGEEFYMSIDVELGYELPHYQYSVHDNFDANALDMPAVCFPYSVDGWSAQFIRDRMDWGRLHCPECEIW